MTQRQPRLSPKQEHALKVTWAYSAIEGVTDPCFHKRTVNSLARKGLAVAYPLHGGGAYMKLTEEGVKQAKLAMKRENDAKPDPTPEQLEWQRQQAQEIERMMEALEEAL